MEFNRGVFAHVICLHPKSIEEQVAALASLCELGAPVELVLCVASARGRCARRHAQNDLEASFKLLRFRGSTMHTMPHRFRSAAFEAGLQGRICHRLKVKKTKSAS